MALGGLAFWETCCATRYDQLLLLQAAHIELWVGLRGARGGRSGTEFAEFVCVCVCCVHLFAVRTKFSGFKINHNII